MLHQLLKDATKAHHDELEQLMYVNEIMNGTLSVSQYRQILTTNYILHKAFEEKLFNDLSSKIATQLKIGHRYKLAALMNDVNELQMEVPQSTLLNISFAKNDAVILGAMYVLEGATLGGSVIVKKLQANPQLNSLGLNFNYYRVYGNNLIPRWKIFCEVLDEQPESTYAAALASAGKMFNAIKQIQQENNKLTV